MENFFPLVRLLDVVAPFGIDDGGLWPFGSVNVFFTSIAVLFLLIMSVIALCEANEDLQIPDKHEKGCRLFHDSKVLFYNALFVLCFGVSTIPLYVLYTVFLLGRTFLSARRLC